MRRDLKHLAQATLQLLRRRRAYGSGAEKMMMMMTTTTMKPMPSTAKTASGSSTSTSSSAARTARPARPPCTRVRAQSTEASASQSESKSKRRSSSIFQTGRPLALLERPMPLPSSSTSSSSSSSSSTSPSSSSSSDLSLWRSGAFAGEIYPDLPVAASWRRLLRAASGGLLDSAVNATTGDAPGAGRRRKRCNGNEGGGESSLSSPSPRPSFVVRTVAAQVRGLGSVRARIQCAAGVGPGGEPLAEEEGNGNGNGNGKKTPHSPDALLLLSGGHPARSLWAPTDSLAMLRAAVELRERGLIPRNVELWGVANPLTEKPERAAVAKAEAGADAILTQPPLSQRAWLRWWEGVQRISRSSSPSSSSGSSVPPIVGGLALPNSPGALRFWITLCGAGNVEGVEEEVAAFAAAAASSSSGAAASPSSAKQREHALSYCRKTLSFYESLGDELAGIHVMPVTAPGREIARQLLEEGALARWDWRREE